MRQDSLCMLSPSQSSCAQGAQGTFTCRCWHWLRSPDISWGSTIAIFNWVAAKLKKKKKLGRGAWTLKRLRTIALPLICGTKIWHQIFSFLWWKQGKVLTLCQPFKPGRFKELLNGRKQNSEMFNTHFS